jgi:hypothetical protein
VGQSKIDNPEKLATLDTQNTRRRQKQTQPSMCWTPWCASKNIDKVNKTRAFLQTARGKVEPNIVNKTRAFLQTTRGKVEPNIVFKKKP